MQHRQDIVLSVPDVSCDHCVKAIDTALSTLPGVETITTDVQAKQVHIRYDDGQLSLQQIESALDEAGYTVAQ